MKKYLKIGLSKTATFLELIIAVILCLGIIIYTIQLIEGVINLDALTGNWIHIVAPKFKTYDGILSYSFTLVIGVELIRMLIHHTPQTVFEVLVFAIARQIVIDHASALSNLIGVMAIAILFATRKFLFCDFDESEKIIFRGNQKVSRINQLLHLHIPCDENDTLADVVARSLDADKLSSSVGACAYFNDVGLRIAQTRDDKIRRVEVIRIMK